MKNFILFILLLTFQLNFAQTTAVCISDEESLYEDLNEISVKKCEIEEAKSSKKVSQKAPFKAIKATHNKHYQKRRTRKNNFIEINSFSKSIHLSDVKNKVTSVKSNITDIALSLKTIENNKIIVSFAQVDEVPSFPSKQENADAFDDFNEKMTDHIDANLIYPSDATIHKLKGIVAVNFIIDINGDIKSIKASCENSAILEEESIRIITLLPKFIPGKHNGNKVNVFYSFQMDFH
ncbi:energy transducer TonB [Tenacibaculum piscium]|uniref:energy transducer TonB n=1 Tax=Tenacibaculum piscium TaxID=1458515 RepID=UPI00187BC025|nr:energy transducer TonB [Tenacibaculum piscium]MBE7690949.1 hypothetical protein [Tenacibaculum piscium]